MTVNSDNSEASPSRITQDENHELPKSEAVAASETQTNNETERDMTLESSTDSSQPRPAQPEPPSRVKPDPAPLQLSNDTVIIPRSKRRGFLGSVTVIPEIERPYNYANRTKWVITGVIALASAAAPLGSAIFFRKL